MNHGFNDVSVLEELDTLDALSGDDDFLPSLSMEEVVSHLVLVGELVRTTLYADFVDLHARVPGLVKDTSGLHIAEFCADESRALARLNVEEFNDKEVVAVDVEAHAVFKVSCCCHKKSVW